MWCSHSGNPTEPCELCALETKLENTEQALASSETRYKRDRGLWLSQERCLAVALTEIENERDVLQRQVRALEILTGIDKGNQTVLEISKRQAVIDALTAENSLLLRVIGRAGPYTTHAPEDLFRALEAAGVVIPGECREELF
jgi:hypothetical protein